MIYFKIIEAPDGTQVLFEKGFDSQAELDALIVSFYLDGLKIVQTMTFEKDGLLDEQFEKADNGFADIIVKNIKQMMEDEIW